MVIFILVCRASFLYLVCRIPIVVCRRTSVGSHDRVETSCAYNTVAAGARMHVDPITTIEVVKFFLQN